MLYQVSRNGQMYGPYSIEDLSRYVASGNVLLTNMAKSEGMTEWVPVWQVLGVASPDAPVPVAGGAAYPVGYAAAYDAPPNLSWGLVFLFGLLTCTFFMYVWNLILAAWANRIVPGSKVLILYIAATVMFAIQAFAGAKVNIMINHGSHPNFDPHQNGPYAGLAFICWIVRLIARFTMRNTLERHYNTVEPIGLRLSGVMTFFFGGVYFQYHLNRISDIKRAMSYRAGGF